MTAQNGTLESLARGLSAAVTPLSNALDSPEALRGFLEELGWQVPDNLTAIGIEPGRIEAVILALQDVAALDYDTVDTSTIFEKYTELLVATVGLAQHIYEAQSRIGAHVNAAYLAATNIANELPHRVLEYLIVEYLMVIHPVVFHSLIVFGLAELIEIPSDDATFTSAHTRRIVHYNRLTKIITAPNSLFRDVYGWDTATANLKLLIERLYDLALVIGLPAALSYPIYEKEVNLSAPVSIPIEGEAENPELHIPILGVEEEVSTTEAGITLMPLPPPSDGEAPGLALCPYTTGALSAAFPLDNQERWILTITNTLDLVVGIGIVFRPGQTLNVLTDILGNASAATGYLNIELRRKALSGEWIPLLGTATGTGLTTTTLYGKISLLVGAGQETDLSVELVTEGGRLRLNFDSVDSFLSTVLPNEPLDLLFDFGIGWSNRRGLYFTGGAGLEYSASIHKEIGPLELETIHFGLKFKDSAIRTFMTISGGAKFGPLAASVESIGLELLLNFPSSCGNLGPADLNFGFKPPNGVGLSIDAGVVKGGGYLYFDFDREEYAGALELVFSEWIALKAIGLITTKMPDGSKGFSLLVIITAEFGSGIQLGFGFTLLEVGGLLGLNRTVNIEPLKDGIRTGAAESVMFPQDVAANAPRIISDLRRFFPPVRDIFLVGPMARIGWGTPTLISASLAVILEFPSVNITILGVVKVVLPDEKKDILRLQVNCIGRFEPSNKLLWFYAELYDSRVLSITLEGGMGLLVKWGDNANFVVSVGGFHPRYSPPPLPFPTPRRLAANILNESWARIRIEGYFAVTSNSVQFGARAELHFGLSKFRLEGHLGFDTLFQFNPFFFSFDLSFNLSVKVFGLGLWSVGFSGLLEGPTPWHIRGKGKISLFFFSISVPFEHTWGGRRATTLEPIEVLPLLEKEFKALTNWEAVVPTNSNLLVSLRKLEKSETDQLVLHPVGKLRISQRKVPLDFKLDKVGNQRPADVHRISVDAAIPSGGSLSISEMEEKFAIGQFKNLDEAGRLSSPAFEPMESGIEMAIAGEQMKASQAVKRVIRYETIIIDNNFKRHVKKFFEFFTTGFAVLYNFLFGHFLKGNAVTKSVLSRHHKKRIQPFEEVIHIQPNRYSVAFNSNNRPVDAGAAIFTSQAKAMEYMQQQIQSDPALANNLHVIPNSEVNLAA